MMKREDALALIGEFITSESLIKHILAVEAGMIGYAKHYNEDVNKWSLAALLHDLDFEKYPEHHPNKGAEILKEKNVEKDVIEAILGHSDETGVKRTTKMAKALYACDELSGFIIACALVRPSKSFEDLKTSSVKKKIKDKAFAKAVDRDILKNGAKDMNLSLDEHITNMIEFLKIRERELNRESKSLLN